MPTATLTKLSEKEEVKFQKKYAKVAKELGLSSDPDDPQHFYDYRGLFKDTGDLEVDSEKHFPSRYKLEGHPTLIVEGIDTRTGTRLSVPTIEELETELQKGQVLPTEEELELRFFSGSEIPIADPDDIDLRSKESLEVAKEVGISLIHAEEIAESLDGQKLERPGFLKRAFYGFVNKAFVQPFKNIQKYSTLGEIDTQLEALKEIRRIKEETGREVDSSEIPKIFEKAKAEVGKRIQAQLPSLQLPPAKGVAEKGLEIVTGVTAFVTKLVIARRFVGGSGALSEIAAFEVVNLVDDGTPGMGVLLASSIGAIGRIPVATTIGKVGKTAAQGGVLASITAMEGGDPEDIAVAFFLPAVLRTINQFPHLVRGKAFESKIAKDVRAKGFTVKDSKSIAKSVRDATEVKGGNMTPKTWGAKHGRILNDIRAKYNKAIDTIVKRTAPEVKGAKAIEKKIGVEPKIAKRAIEIAAKEGVAKADQYISAAKILGPEAAEIAITAPSKTVEAIIPEKAPVVRPAKKPKIEKPIEITRDILGGVDPLIQIHKALREAKQVRPITEAKKKEALRKRVGAAAGALRANLKKGMPAEQAIQLSTGLLKGPLTEYDQLYESIEDSLEPDVKDTAYQQIARHPDLKYFEIVNTQKSFQKLLQGASITPNEAQQIEKVFGKAFEEQLAKVTTKSDLYDRLITYWKATLLTGLKTSGLNILSTAGHAMTETTKDVPAALIDKGISLVTGERTVAFTTKGFGIGFKEGLGKGWKYLRTGHDERNVGEKYDYKKTNYGTSKIARTIQATTDFIFHLLGAEDQPWYYGAHSRSLHSQAIAQAKTKKLKGKEFKTFVNNLQKNPTDEMLIWAKEDAETAIYTNRTNLGDLGKAIQKVKGGEIIVPFARTPSAVAMQIINYSPVGVVKEIAHEIHEGKFNQRKFSQAAGRTVVGTAALYLGAQLFKAGLIALGFPKTEKERKLWELEGRKPNSIKVGDKWRDVQAFGPTGNLLVIGGYFQQALDSKGSPTEAIIEAMAGGAKSFTEQTFVRGVNLAVDALTDPEASFERWFTSMSGSLVPTIVADIARAQDDRERRAVGPKERIQSRIPIYRKGLPPKIDVFGQDIPRYGGNVLESMADPTRPSKIRQDVVVDELRRLWDKDIKVSPTLLGDKAGYDILTKEENTQLWRRAGELTYKGLFGVVNTKDYEKANDFIKGQLINFITGQAKAAAKAEIANIKLKQGVTVLKLAESGLLSIDSLEALKYFQESIIETKEEKGKGILR